MPAKIGGQRRLKGGHVFLLGRVDRKGAITNAEKRRSAKVGDASYRMQSQLHCGFLIQEHLDGAVQNRLSGVGVVHGGRESKDLGLTAARNRR